MISFNLNTAIKILFFFFLVFAGLYFAKPFLAPFSIAALLAMLFMPLSKKLEKKGLPRALSTIVCLLLLVAAMSGIIALISTQIAGISRDAPKLKKIWAKSLLS